MNNLHPTSPALGLVGGIGVTAGINYYRRIHHAHVSANRSLSMLYAHADTAVARRSTVDDGQCKLSRHLSDLINRLAAGGASLATITLPGATVSDRRNI